MTVAAVLTQCTEGLPELEVGCARTFESGVGCAQRSAREVSRTDGGGGE